MHAQANCYRSPLPEELATRLAQITPSSIDTFFFTNSGAEATEAAVKLARHATGRPNVIVVQGGFHGRTYLTMAMTTSKVGVRAGYQPLPAGIFATSFPRPFAWRVDEATAVERALADLRLLLLTQTAPAETAAFVMEPVLGEGGYLPAPIGVRARRPARSAPSTGSCSSPTRCRPASRAPAACSRSSTPAWSPTSW